MVLIGLLAGIALPRLSGISQRFEIAAQRKSILMEIGNLGYRAYTSGQAIELTSQPAPDLPTPPVTLNGGWKLEVPNPIRYGFNGVCSGGKIVLVSPDDNREEFELQPPLCKVTSEQQAS